MQNWKNYFLKEAKQFGLCVHQKDLDTQDKTLYPFKEKFDNDYWQKKIEKDTEQLEKMKNDFNYLLDKYNKQKESYCQQFEQYKNFLKNTIIYYRECYNNISNLQCEEKTISNIVKLSCLSSTKKKLYELEEFQKNYKFVEFEQYGEYRKNIIDSLQKSIEDTKDIIEKSKKRIEEQNKNIDDLYKTIGLNSDDFYMIQLECDELNSSHRKRRGGTAPNRALSQENK